MMLLGIIAVFTASLLPEMTVFSQETSFFTQIGGRVERASEHITNTIVENWYDYSYDGPAGASPSQISDGGSDMYDGGNRVTVTDSGASLNQAVVYGESYNYADTEIISYQSHPFITLVWIKNPNAASRTYTIAVSGNAGADNSGRATSYSKTFTEGGATVQIRASQVSAATDPSICEVYFVISGNDWNSDGSYSISPSFGTGTNDLSNSLRVSGTPRNVMMGYILLSRTSGSQVSDSDMDAAAHAILWATYGGGFVQEVVPALRGKNDLIRGSFPLWYSYNYDGSASAVPGVINDGGGDMYDGGNRVYFGDESGQVPLQYNQYYSYDDYEIVSMTAYPFATVAWISNPNGNSHTYSLRVTVNAGADGGGSYISSSRYTISASGGTMQYYYYQVYNAGDPSICEVYFIIYGNKWGSAGVGSFSSQFGSGTSGWENTVQLTGSPQGVMMGYTLLSESGGAQLSTSEINNAMTQVLFGLFQDLDDSCVINQQQCDTNARCVDDGCVCNEGYVGEGTTCQDFDECTNDQYSCNENAHCVNNVGSYGCVCNDGYTGDGSACTDVDECSTNGHDCDVNAHCVNTAGGYNCTCNDGYAGNGINCADVNECDNHDHDCDENAYCTNNVGSYDCTCNEEYYGNGTSCIVAVSVVCQPSSIIVQASRLYFEEKNIQMNDLHLNDFSCVADVDASSGDVWIFETPTMSSCSNELVVNDTHFEYRNTLSNTVANGIYTGNLVTSRLSCLYQRDLEGITLQFEYAVIGNTAVFDINDVGTFAAAMNRYTNDNYTQTDSRTEFNATDTLYIELALNESPPGFHLVAERCWITPTADPLHEDQFAFIEEGCPADGREDDVTITRSGNGPVAAFESAIFAFADYDTTFLHCSLYICYSIDNTSCVPSCLGGRAKRSLISSKLSAMRKKRQADENGAESPREIVSLGPFIVDREDVENIIDNLTKEPEKEGLSETVMIAILAAVAVIVLACLAVTVYWFKRSSRSQMSRELADVAFSNPAMTKE